jgi:hypothetical protein
MIVERRTLTMRKTLTLAIAALALGGLTAPAFAADAAPAAAAAKPAYSTADTDIGTLIDTPATRAILDAVMPGFATNDQVAMARPMTLRAIQQYAPDQITTAKLDQIDAELAKLPAAK